MVARPPAVTTDRLTRRFGTRVAVDGLSVVLPSEGVIGLVGPNGSGKSTLIRMLLGLVRPTEGEASVLGRPITQPRSYAASVGAFVEGPSFTPSLSARANLLALARLRGLPAGRVDEVLRVVGLTGREREPVRRFSLGMKQRLGIAAALLPDPALLVLDEPTNGLDPAGIVEIRALLRRLGTDGRTVVVSSHLLSEIESVCTHLVVVRFGELVFDGPIGELMERATQRVRVAPEDPRDLDRLAEVLRAAGWETVRETDTVHVQAGAADAGRINRSAAAGGITLATLTSQRDSLEEVFLAMTGDRDADLAADRAANDTDRKKVSA